MTTDAGVPAPQPAVPAAALVYRERIWRRFGPRLTAVRLYGSYARGEAHEESDIDVLVLVDDLTHREKIEAIELGAEVSLENAVTLSPLVMDARAFDELRRLEARLALDIDREGVEL